MSLHDRDPLRRRGSSAPTHLRGAVQRMRGDQCERLLDLALALWASRRRQEAVWCGKTAYQLDPDNRKVRGRLHIMGVTLPVAPNFVAA